LERLERILRKRKSLAVREAVDLDAQALPPLLRQFRETLGQLPSLGTTSASVRSHLQNSNQLIVVLSEKNVGRLDETLIGYCFSEMVFLGSGKNRHTCADFVTTLRNLRCLTGGDEYACLMNRDGDTFL
jgi:hypothetical protein